MGFRNLEKAFEYTLDESKLKEKPVVPLVLHTNSEKNARNSGNEGNLLLTLLPSIKVNFLCVKIFSVLFLRRRTLQAFMEKLPERNSQAHTHL